MLRSSPRLTQKYCPPIAFHVTHREQRLVLARNSSLLAQRWGNAHELSLLCPSMRLLSCQSMFTGSNTLQPKSTPMASRAGTTRLTMHHACTLCKLPRRKVMPVTPPATQHLACDSEHWQLRSCTSMLTDQA